MTRLVAKSYTQIYETDYKEIFTSVININTVRILLSIAVNKKMDVKNILLQGTLKKRYICLYNPVIHKNIILIEFVGLIN
jgi:Reverse transcriptase (RNA-dependent DNA polymerase)